MNKKTLYSIAGFSYLGIFFSAIFANFFVLEGLKEDPVGMATSSMTLVSLGAVAFLVTSVLDVIVAWVLKDLYHDHPLSTPSTYFRLMHAIIMGVAVFALVAIAGQTNAETILGHVDLFETIWLIGLFFFGVHLMMLSYILTRVIPKWMALMLFVAGAMYMIDTTAQFTLANYATYADTFLTLVAIPSILGEMSFSVWLLLKSRK